MIALDTSALMAIVLQEPAASRCSDVLFRERERVMSAGTVAEALIVAERRNAGAAMRKLLDELTFECIAVTPASARRAAAAYARWGKGVHPAGLNFGDCFSYELAKEHSCKLLYVGNDFSQTDVESA